MFTNFCRISGVAVVALLLVAGCSSPNKDQRSETAGVPIALLEIPRWSVELAARPKGAKGDSAFVVYSGSMKQLYPANAQRYLDHVKDRLVAKHGVDLAENFPDHGYIVIELSGYEIEYVDSYEGLELNTGSFGGVSRSPQYADSKDRVKQKSHTADVFFFDRQMKCLWKIEVEFAKKPKQVADAIAKYLKRPKTP